MMQTLQDIKEFFKKHGIALAVLSVSAVMLSIWVAILLVILYAIIKWDKPRYIKIIALIGIIITWPIWSAVAFVTSASIIAWDKPYCVMVTNKEYFDQKNEYWRQYYTILTEKYGYRKTLNKKDRKEVEAKIVSYPKILRYRPVEKITDITILQLFTTDNMHLTGSMNRIMHSTFYAILLLSNDNKQEVYNWSHTYQTFASEVANYNEGYPKKDICTLQKYFLLKTLFNI